MRRLALLMPLLIALVAGMTACADTTNGSPVAGDTTENEPTTTARSTPRPPTTSRGGGSGGGGSPVKDTDPCSLLNSSAKTQLGLSGEGEAKRLGSSRTCTWKLPGPRETYFLGTGISDTLGLDDIPSNANPKPLNDVGKHKAVQTSGGGGPGSCSVLMGVTDSSRVETTVVAGTDTDKACDLAMQMAQLVEPELPEA